MTHRWGPWMERLTAYGDTSGYAARACADCPVTDSTPLLTLCEWRALSRWQRRRRQ